MKPTLAAAAKTLLCGFVVGLLLLTLPVHAARLALVIGNDAYRNVAGLRNAGNDAQLMAATLRAAGFELIGGVRTNLDRNGLWSALEQFKARISKGDEVVFYFAGHGVQVDATQLLLPVDIAPQSEEQVGRDAVPLFQVQNMLREARFALVVVDACRDNPFPPRAGGTRSIGETRGLAPPTKAVEGSVVVMAAASGEKALDTVPGGTSANGLFTHELVNALKTRGLDVLGAVRQTRARVVQLARRVNHAQRPTYVDELAEGEFVLFPASVPTPAHVEQQAWETAQRANTVAGFDAYLAEYPGGRFAAAARVARASLLPTPRAEQRLAPATLPEALSFWTLDQFPTWVNDRGVIRRLKLATRSQFPGNVQLGLFESISQDRGAITVHFSEKYRKDFKIEDIGIECRGSGLCVDREVQTRDGVIGTLQYVFQNGDVVINDLNQGIKLRPVSSLRN